jgi:FkbM family methyltransferase
MVIGRFLFETGEFEYDKIQKAIALARDIGVLCKGSSDYVIDVGANIGTVCITLVRERIFARALAIEPEPRNFRLLTKNIRRSGLSSSIRALPLSLSSSDGRLDLELSTDNFGDHRIKSPVDSSGESYYGEAGRRIITVPCRRLDTLLEELAIKPGDVKLLWMDVQGYELRVLQGAETILAGHVPVVTEFGPYWIARAGITQQEFSAYLGSHFAWYYDLGEANPQRRRTADIGAMFERYTHRTFSDLLLLP